MDIGGAQVEAIMASSGPVTVVFENGLATALEEWDAVVPSIAQRARTVRYNRRRPAPSGKLPVRAATDLAADLRALLNALGVSPPYVLVAHSWGGVIARTSLMRTRRHGGGRPACPVHHHPRSSGHQMPVEVPEIVADAIVGVIDSSLLWSQPARGH